jgi:hypothetical protein
MYYVQQHVGFSGPRLVGVHAVHKVAVKQTPDGESVCLSRQRWFGNVHMGTVFLRFLEL